MKKIHVARSAYTHLPPRTRSNLARVLRFVPESVKWGPSYSAWRKRLATSRNDPAFVRDYQDRARRAMLTLATERSPFYRDLFAKTFANEAGSRLLDETYWNRIPILKSCTVVQHARAMCTRPLAELDIGSTGGTSGTPVKFHLDKTRSPIEYAFVHDAWSRAGFRAGDARCVFRGLELDDPEHSHMHYERALAELRCSVFHLTDDTMRKYYDEIVARRIRFIHGYPSAISIFAAFLVRAGLAPLSQVEGVFPTSERFNAIHREITLQAFNHAMIVPFYGLSEKVAFAIARPDDIDVFELNRCTAILNSLAKRACL